MGSTWQRGTALAALLATVVGARPALAEPSAAELASARQLFSDANKDEDAGRWAEASAKLHLVADVRLTAGVRYHLALCDENLGHLAAALEGFNAAQAQAQADRANDVLRLVGKQLAVLGPRVPRLTVRIVPAVPGAVVKLDDAPLSPTLVGTPLPLDPGPHRVEASAEGRASAAARVTLAERDATSIELTLPEAAPTPVAAPMPAAAAGPEPASPRPSAPEPEPPSRAAPIVATVGALVLAGGGVGAFLLAGNAVTTGTTQCASEATAAPCTSQKNTVRAWDFTAAGAWTAAAALGVVAVVLWAQGGSREPATALVVGPGAAGVEGRF